jgi:hypothetical protein
VLVLDQFEREPLGERGDPAKIVARRIDVRLQGGGTGEQEIAALAEVGEPGGEAFGAGGGSGGDGDDGEIRGRIIQNGTRSAQIGKSRLDVRVGTVDARERRIGISEIRGSIRITPHLEKNVGVAKPWVEVVGEVIADAVGIRDRPGCGSRYDASREKVTRTMSLERNHAPKDVIGPVSIE